MNKLTELKLRVDLAQEAYDRSHRLQILADKEACASKWRLVDEKQRYEDEKEKQNLDKKMVRLRKKIIPP